MSKYTREQLVKFLRLASDYFENRDTEGEDRVYWANVYNAEKCIAAADMLEKDKVS